MRKEKYIIIFSIIILSLTILIFESKARLEPDSDIAGTIYTNSDSESFQEYKNGIDESNGKIETSRHTVITNAVKICGPAIVGINVTEVLKVPRSIPKNNDSP